MSDGEAENERNIGLDEPAEWRVVHQRRFDPGSRGDLGVALGDAIEELEGPTATPLYEYVDVDALEAAFFGTEEMGPEQEWVGRVEFRYEEYLVEVRSDGWVAVYAPEAPWL